MATETFAPATKEAAEMVDAEKTGEDTAQMLYERPNPKGKSTCASDACFVRYLGGRGWAGGEGRVRGREGKRVRGWVGERTRGWVGERTRGREGVRVRG
jgi:hypothetical protein